MKELILFKKSTLRGIAFWMLMLISPMLWAQPTVKVPANCEVVVTGSGIGVSLGLGGTVGSGGIVVMPDPFDIPGTGGNFTLVPNGTTVTNWSLAGDLSVQTTNVPPAAAVQNAGAVALLNIESYNKNLRPAEYAPLSPASNSKWGRSKGRVTLGYSQPPCNNSITFEIYKKYSNVSPSWAPPIIGPECLLPNQKYTYSVDQIASDNASNAIGFDRYYWSGLPVGSTGVYTSADESSITFTTGSSVSQFTIKCCFGRANNWDGDAGAANTTCVTKFIGAIPATPAFITAPPTCLATGVTSFNITLTPVPGYTYTWSEAGTSWSLNQYGAQNANLAVSGVDNNSGVLTLTVDNGTCEPAEFIYPINRNFVAPSAAISGPTCISPGSTNTYSLPGNTLINNTTWTLPSGWVILTTPPTNSRRTIVSVQVPSSAPAGAYTLIAQSTDCPSTSISYTVYVRPLTPTFTAAPNCFVRNSGTPQTYTVTTSPGATGYSWVFPSGWSPASITTSTPTVTVTPGGTLPSGIVTVTALGAASSCNSATTSFTVNYVTVAPNTITASCWNVGLAGTTTLTVANAPSPFYGTYTVTSVPAGLFSSYSVNSAGIITLNTLATASGTYSLTITHVSGGPCTPASTNIPVTVTGNGSSVALTADVPGAGNCDQYIVTRPVGSTVIWRVDGIVAVNSPTVNIFGNTLTLCGSTAPSTVCADVTFNGCTTRTCATSVGTHGMRLGNTGNTDNTIKGVNLYPNPNNGNFYINIDDIKESASAVLNDSAGKHIKTFTLKKGENRIDSEGIAKGNYIVVLIIDGKKESRQIIIK